MLFTLILLSVILRQNGAYLVGVGRADCTGPPVEIVFMGYGKSSQVGCGIHLRQFSRAYVVDDGQRRIAFVTVDVMGTGYAVRKEVLKKLDTVYPNVYDVNNVIISSIHTHSTPGGFLEYVLYDFSTYGFAKETFDSLVEGISQSVIEAHKNMVQAKIYISTGVLLNASINRSPASYLMNPEEERAKYPHNTDKEMVQLLFVRESDQKPIAIINWFAIHATSMNNTNCLVSSDNLGYASILLESYFNNGSLPGKGAFVGAFASSNQGDVSPNVKGPICVDTGDQCDFITSSCDAGAQVCQASGPGSDMFESTSIIAHQMFEKAKELFHQDNKTEVTGPIKYVHQFVNMTNQQATVTLSNGTQLQVHGCLPAMGYSFGAGTTDGPGMFNIRQGSTHGDWFWNVFARVSFPLYMEDVECHRPKPILFNTGRENIPYYPWQPQIVSTQIVTIGQVVLIAVPAEFTTMSGRRLRNAVKEVTGLQNATPIITGLSNIYSSYVTTFEEYQLQRYEGASTIFGPHTLDLYINQYIQLAKSLIMGRDLVPGPTPPDFRRDLVSLITSPGIDGFGDRQFGDCLQQPPSQVKSGQRVTVKFAAGNPRHDLLHGDTYLTVEKLIGDNWTVVATDANWETRFHWEETNWMTRESVATIEWISSGNGSYRIGHKGHHKNIFGLIYPYTGESQNFTVIADNNLSGPRSALIAESFADNSSRPRIVFIASIIIIYFA